jgi:hypothetical protein
MAAASEYDIALSMMRLWGSEAKNLARKYALEHECSNNAVEAGKWYAVLGIVASSRSTAPTCVPVGESGSGLSI